MHKVFLRILPLAAAVLLLASCSKDENSDNAPVNNEPETVVTKEKTVTISGTASKEAGLSKISTDGTNLTFDGTETIHIEGDGGKIHGDAKLADNGSFTVTLYYPAEEELSYLNGKTVTATIGSEPTTAIEYENINVAVKNVYEKSNPVEIKVDGETCSFGGVNFEMDVQVAFVKNEKAEAISVSVNGGTPVPLEAGKICIVPVDVKVTADGKTKNTTVAGQIYTIKAPASVPEGYVDLGITDDNGPVYWAQNNLEGTYTWAAAITAATTAGGELPTKADFEALANACYWVWSESPKGMYAYKLRDGQTSNCNVGLYNNAENYSTSTDPSYIFLPVTPGYSYGRYWSSTENVLDTDYALCLYFGLNSVNPQGNYDKTGTCPVRAVRRSN